MTVPLSTSSCVSRCHSSSEPSAHSTRSGLVRVAISRTHASSFACLVGASSSPGMVVTDVMRASPSRVLPFNRGGAEGNYPAVCRVTAGGNTPGTCEIAHEMSRKGHVMDSLDGLEHKVAELADAMKPR